jgi:hypothetical protein
MEAGKKMSWDDDEAELARAVKLLAGTTAIPFKVAADIAGDLIGSLEQYVPKPTGFASQLIEMRITTLKTITTVIEKEISLLEQYKASMAAKAEKREKVKVE